MEGETWAERVEEPAWQHLRQQDIPRFGRLKVVASMQPMHIYDDGKWAWKRIDAERLTMSFSTYEIDEIVNRTGSLVWEGEMAISGERNRPVTTAIPLKDMLREKGPGIYLAVAERADLRQDEYAEPATN